MDLTTLIIAISVALFVLTFGVSMIIDAFDRASEPIVTIIGDTEEGTEGIPDPAPDASKMHSKKKPMRRFASDAKADPIESNEHRCIHCGWLNPKGSKRCASCNTNPYV